MLNKSYFRILHIYIFITLLLAANYSVFTQNADDKVVSSKEAMVTTAHPLATKAAMEMLKKGGNAVDAAVAAAFAIGVVEPDGSGIGGGGGMTIYLKNLDKVFYINYYQRASENVKKLNYNNSSDGKSAKAILVPGTVAGLTLALEKFGTLPLPVILEPAIRYAEQGFPIDETLGKILLDNIAILQKYPSTSEIYLVNDLPLMQDDTLKQTELAKTLRIIASKGKAGFYEGEVAEKMVKEIGENEGVISLNDLKSYEAKLTEPVKGNYRGYDVYSAAVPQSGASIIEALNILENDNLYRLGRYDTSANTLHLIAETLRRVYADRTAFIQDPDYETIPVTGLTSKDFAITRYNDINRYIAEPKEYRKTKAGNPLSYDNSKDTRKSKNITDENGEEKGEVFDDKDDDGSASYGRQDDDPFGAWGLKKKKSKKIIIRDDLKKDTTKEIKIDDKEYDGGHTTHLCIADKDGNMVSLTQTLGTFFGSGFTSAGVLLNCSMTNFSYTGSLNQVEPRKQPRSSIAPTIILKNNKPFLAVGTPGATRIISTIVGLIVNVIDFKMPVDEANYFPRFFCQKNDDYMHLENRISNTVIKELERKGHNLRIYGDYDLFFGGAQMISFDSEKHLFYGSADPRRGGTAVGD